MIKLWICGLLFSTLSLCASVFIENSVVKVHVTIQKYDCCAPWAPPNIERCTGSGCIIADNQFLSENCLCILTNAHLVTGSTFIEVQSEDSCQRFEACVIKIGYDCDLAILEVVDNRFFKGKTPLVISKCIAKQQEKVQVYGFPYGGPLTVVKGNIFHTVMSFYQHSYAFLLTSHINSTIYPGNSGGPVIMGGEIVGIVHERTVYSVDEGLNRGRMIPVPVVQHFLQEQRAKQYQGFPEFSVQAQAVLNPSMRAYFGLDGDQGGLLITEISQGYFLCKILQVGDILIEIDGYKIDCSGYVTCKDLALQLPVDYVVAAKYFGETLKFSVLRNGKKLHLSAYIDPARRGSSLIKLDEYNRAPTYYVFGGLVLQPLTRAILEHNLDISVVLSSIDLFYHAFKGKLENQRNELVVITRVLDDPINAGYQNIEKEVVKEVNGYHIHNMRHMLEILMTCQDPYYFIVTENDTIIIFDRQNILKQTPTILHKYSIPCDCSKDLQQFKATFDTKLVQITNLSFIYNSV